MAPANYIYFNINLFLLTYEALQGYVSFKAVTCGNLSSCWKDKWGDLTFRQGRNRAGW